MHLTFRETTYDEMMSAERVPGSFTVESVFRFRSPIILEVDQVVEEPLEEPWVKDYDEVITSRPECWAAQWDLESWGFLAARDGDRLVGTAAVAWRTEGMEMLLGRDDVAVLWDIRVRPDVRGRGVGTALLRSAMRWALNRGCRLLRVETQDINVPVCKFYSKNGFRLSRIEPGAYEDLPEETKLVWELDL